MCRYFVSCFRFCFVRSLNLACIAETLNTHEGFTIRLYLNRIYAERIWVEYCFSSMDKSNTTNFDEVSNLNAASRLISADNQVQSSADLSIIRSSRSPTRKNYAPIDPRILNLGGPSEVAIRHLRQNKYDNDVIFKNYVTEELRAEANKKDVKVAISTKRQQNREGYAMRMQKYADEFKVRRDPPVNYSPWLTMSVKMNIVDRERVIAYNQKHKCPHGRRFTSFDTIYHEKRDGTKVPSYIEVSCHCNTEHITNTLVELPCGNCSSKFMKVVIDKTYSEDIFLCQYCKLVKYTTPSKNVFHFFRPTRNHIGVDVKDTYKRNDKLQWGSQALKDHLKNVITKNVDEPIIIPFNPTESRPKFKIDEFVAQAEDVIIKDEDFPSLNNGVDAVKESGHMAVKEFGEGIFEYVKTTLKGAFEAFMEWCKIARDHVVHYVVDVAMRTAAEAFWDALVVFLTTLCEMIETNPLLYIMSIYRLAFCQSWAERMLIMTAYIIDERLTKAWNKLWFYFDVDGMVGSLGQIKKHGREFAEDYNAKARKRAEAAAAERMATFDPIVTEPEDDSQSQTSFNSDRFSEFASAKKQAGSMTDFTAFIVKIFGICSKSLKPLLSTIKEFNTVCSGWKNLHELVSSILQYLPNWMTKIFTITDPVKRFCTEAKQPGNPIYDTVEAYKFLYTGDNCGSANAYEDFTEKFKLSTTYIATEYPVSDKVPRLHNRLRTDAMSIMRPIMSGSKPIPFVVTIRGPPGTGKSSSWYLPISGITGGTSATLHQMAYVRNTASDFWDGYNPEKHHILLYDDFAASIDDPCIGELMQTVSSNQYLPPFASIDNLDCGIKGTSCTPKIVVLLTNFHNYDHCKQIASRVAVMRRLGYIIEWDQKYDKGVKYKMWKAQENGTQVQLENKDGSNKFTMSEIQKLLGDAFEEHMDKQTDVSEKLDVFMSKGITNWKDKYDNAKSRSSMTHTEKTDLVKEELKRMASEGELPEKVEAAVKELGEAFGAYVVLAAIYAVADSVDVKYKNMFLWASALSLFLMALYALRKSMAVPESGEVRTPKVNNKPIFVRTPMEAAKQEGDKNDEGTIKKISLNHVVIVNQDKKYVNGLFIKGRILLTVKHWIESSEGEITIYSHRAADQHIYTVDLSTCYRTDIANVDLCLLELPSFVQPYADLTRYLTNTVMTKETDGYTTRRSALNDLIIHTVRVYPGKFDLQFAKGDGTMYRSTCDFSYTFVHAMGDCGNLILARVDGNLKLVGMHESGSLTNPRTSFAAMLHADEIKKALNLLHSEALVSREEDFVYENAQYESGYGLNKTQFVATSNAHISSSGRSDLIHSRLFDKIQTHITEPALLRVKGDIDPMANALSKFGLSEKQFPPQLVQQAVDSLSEQLNSFKNQDDITRELTLHECLNGIPGQIESVDLSTSSGYPFSLKTKTRGAKRLVIDGEPGNLTLNAEAQASYDRWTDLFSRNIVPKDPYLATLKDERRAIEKVKVGKTRLFCAGSLTSFMHNKRLFGGFSNYLKRLRGDTFSTLGLNRASIEWHQMIQKFREVGQNGIDGDQEQWDGRLKAGVAMALVSLINTYYGVENNSKVGRERYICFLHSIFPILRVSWNYYQDGVVPFTFFVEISGCMPSGWYLTFVVNSLVNAVLMRMAWMTLIMPPFNDLKYFRTFVREKYAGDDSLLTVADPFLDMFNGISIGKFLADFGQKYTPASKTGELIPYQNINDCTFLKTKTGFLYDRYVPLFDMAANLETTNWIRKTDNEFKATEDNCNDVLRNLFFYGKVTFDKYRNLMLFHLPELNLISYYSLESAFLGYGSLPDPYGTFGYSKDNRENPARYRAAVERIQALKHQIDNASQPAMKESGFKNSMNMNVNMNTQQAVPVGTLSNLDDSTPQTTTKSGVHLTEQQQTIRKLAADGNVRMTNIRADLTMNEDAWDLESMLSRFNLISSFDWPLTAPPGAYLQIAPGVDYSLAVPLDLLRNNLAAMPFQRFTFWKCDMVVVRFQLTASRFHQGRLGIYFDPTMKYLPSNTGYTALRGATHWTQLQHAFLDPSDGTVIDLEIPFRFNKGWVNLLESDCLGMLSAKVLNQLQAATGASTTVQIKVFVSFVNSQFKVPQLGGSSYSDLAVKQTGILATIGNAVGGELDKLAESIIPKDIVGALCDLDKVAVTQIPPPIIVKDAQYMSNSRGIENLERLALEPSAQYLTGDQFGNFGDEMDLAFLLKKKNYLTTFNWAATAPVGTVLFSTLVSPTHVLKRDSSTEFDATIIGTIASMFTYWRGSIVFEFQIVGTPFHEGRLDFSNHPAITTTPTDYPTMVSQYVNSQTIRNTNNTVMVRIPYLSDIPWKRVWCGEAISLTDGEPFNTLRAADFILGMFNVSVSVPLKNPSNVTSNVDVNVFVSAGDDFELNTLSLCGGFLKTAYRAPPSREIKREDSESSYDFAVKESGDMNTAPKSDSGVITLGRDSLYTHDVDPPHFGEKYTNFREMMKRYQLGPSYQVSVSPSTDEINNYTISGTIDGLFYLLSTTFRLFRGPMNYKVTAHFSNDSGNVAMWHGFITANQQPPPQGTAATPTAQGVTYSSLSNGNYSFNRPALVRFSNTQVGEFQVPFQSIYHSLLMYRADEQAGGISYFDQDQYFYQELVATFCNCSNSANMNGRICFSYAFADETRMGVFAGFPRFSIPTPAPYPLPDVSALIAQ